MRCAPFSCARADDLPNNPEIAAEVQVQCLGREEEMQRSSAVLACSEQERALVGITLLSRPRLTRCRQQERFGVSSSCENLAGLAPAGASGGGKVIETSQGTWPRCPRPGHGKEPAEEKMRQGPNSEGFVMKKEKEKNKKKKKKSLEKLALPFLKNFNISKDFSGDRGKNDGIHEKLRLTKALLLLQRGRGMAWPGRRSGADSRARGGFAPGFSQLGSREEAAAPRSSIC